jgi:hypothetical protein
MKQKTAILFMLTLIAGIGFSEIDIPEAGRIRVDGNLTDWRRAKWIPIETVIQGNTNNISNARWSTAWDEDAVIYIALQYDDADIVLQNGTHSQDGIEIYVRSDTGSAPKEYAEKQQSAQRYSIGLSNDETTTWVRLGDFEKIPIHNKASAVAKIENNTFTYEARVPLYDWFDDKLRSKCSKSEIYIGDEIGLDIALIDARKDGAIGMLGINTRDKRTDANQIAEHTLDD